MRVLVTRPEPDGERTAALLLARGLDVMLAPLMRIEPVDAGLDDGPWHALALTSANAARAIASHPRLQTLLGIPAYAVGGRTADAACAVGFDNVISAQGDAADLVHVIRTHLPSGARVLHLAGEDRSSDLPGDLAAAGIAVTVAVIYRAAAVAAFPDAVREALSAGRLDAVVHFSRRSAGIYLKCASAGGLLDKALRPSHYCLSRQVAEPLMAAGAGRVRIAKRPTEADLVDVITA